MLEVLYEEGRCLRESTGECCLNLGDLEQRPRGESVCPLALALSCTQVRTNGRFQRR